MELFIFKLHVDGDFNAVDLSSLISTEGKYPSILKSLLGQDATISSNVDHAGYLPCLD